MSARQKVAGERSPDEESILNGWVRRYFALQQKVCAFIPCQEPQPLCWPPLDV